MRVIRKPLGKGVMMLFTALFSLNGHAACFEALSFQDQGARFEILEDGAVVRDSWTGLAWARCLLGETWNSTVSRCDGVASQLSWSDALAAAASADWAGSADWRAANVKELESIVDRSCASPALNTSAFSGQTEGVNVAHWSATQVESYSLGAWTVNFKNGSVIPIEKDTLLPVRLVREP